MRYAPVVCCALLLGVAAGCGSRAETASKAFERADASKLVLGPRDLGRGYAMGDDTACGPFPRRGSATASQSSSTGRGPTAA